MTLSFGGQIAHFGALGRYDAATNTLEAGVICVAID